VQICILLIDRASPEDPPIPPPPISIDSPAKSVDAPIVESEPPPDISRSTSVTAASEDEIRREAGPSKREKRRAKEAKKKVEEEEEIKTAKANRKAARGSRSKGQATPVEAEPPQSVGKATRKPGPPEEHFEIPKNKKASKGKQNEQSRVITEADIEKTVESIEEKCQKLKERWENEWEGMSASEFADFRYICETGINTDGAMPWSRMPIWR
jgi:hypothetical protein